MIVKTTVFARLDAQMLVKTTVFACLDAEMVVKTTLFACLGARMIVKATVFACLDAEILIKTMIFENPSKLGRAIFHFLIGCQIPYENYMFSLLHLLSPGLGS